jgi:type VI secretion system protein
MPFKFAFIEHIAGRSALHPDAEPPASMIQAVKESLVLLLNTRQGQVPYLQDYGLPDLSDIIKSYPDSLFHLGLAIKTTINKYEPRIQNVRVTLLSSSTKFFEAKFTIQGILLTEDKESQQVKFQTTLSHNGFIKVK